MTAPLHIDNVPDLGEQKTAWDHVSFEGFLGARMSLQLTWTGLDSALAAPLVLDLARLTAAAHAAGEAGPLSAPGVLLQGPGRQRRAPLRRTDDDADRVGHVAGPSTTRELVHSRRSNPGSVGSSPIEWT